MPKQKNYLVTRDIEEIFFYVEYNSNELFNVLKDKREHDLTLIRKYLTHSDISTRGKLTKQKTRNTPAADVAKQCILYYQSYDELSQLDGLPVAAQSNIMLPDEFYAVTNVNSYTENGNQQRDIVKDNGITVYIPKDTCRDFNVKTLIKICRYNNKFIYEPKWLKKLENFKLENYWDGQFNLLKADALHIAAHGLGTDKDKLLAYIRAFVFKGDVLNLIYDKTENILYLFFERNEEYYSILNKIRGTSITAPIWRSYSETDKKKIVELLYATSLAEGLTNGKQEIIDPDILTEKKIASLLKTYYMEYQKTIDDFISLGKTPKYRWYQKKWREVLIKIDEVRFHEKGIATCAISKTKGEYSKLGRFFIASHIKPYADCIKEEDYESAFDPNNGLILCANIDALFDQYLISVDADGKIVTCNAVKAIRGQEKFKYEGDDMDSYYLTDKRKAYLALHKEQFDARN